MEKNKMRMSQAGIDKLAEWEGNVATADGMHFPYDDHNGEVLEFGDPVIGYLTIGYGHLLTRSELTSEKISATGIEYWNGLTESEARELLDYDVEWAEQAVNDYVNVDLAQFEFEALVSFTFNVGKSAFKNSTLLRLLNQGEYTEVPTQLARWNRTGGRVSQGLINRRQHETDHWLGN